MTLYEIIIACVASTNLVLTLVSLREARAKVAASKLHELESSLRGDLHELERAINEVNLANSKHLTPANLVTVYADLKMLTAQVGTLMGQQETMNELLRQLLGQQLRRTD